MAKLIRTRWSKLKKEVESRFAKSITGHAALFRTGYHGIHNEAGRWSILIDGVEVGGGGDCISWRSNRAFYDPAVSMEAGNAEVRNKGLHGRDMMSDALREYLNLSIEDALTSPDPLIRSLAVLDHRTGKARLRKLRTSQISNSLERRCLEFRCKVEGICLPNREGFPHPDLK